MTTGATPANRLAELMAQLSSWRQLNPSKKLEELPPPLHPVLIEIMQLLSDESQGTIDLWHKVKIHTIVRKSSRFIVFLDEGLDIYWWWIVAPPDEALLGKIQAQIAQLTHESAFLLTIDSNRLGVGLKPAEKPSPQAENIRSVIAEAMAVLLNGGSEADCENVLAVARRQISVAKDQLCRPVFFWAFVFVVALMGIVTVLWNCWGQLCCRPENYDFVLTWLQASVAGAFGAMISAVVRTTELGLEPSSGTRGLRVEAIARALIGAAAGILTTFAFDSGLIAKAALSPDPVIHNTVRLFLCVAAGASERILPALVGKAESLVASQKDSATAQQHENEKGRGVKP